MSDTEVKSRPGHAPGRRLHAVSCRDICDNLVTEISLKGKTFLSTKPALAHDVCFPEICLRYWMFPAFPDTGDD